MKKTADLYYLDGRMCDKKEAKTGVFERKETDKRPDKNGHIFTHIFYKTQKFSHDERTTTKTH